MSLPPTRILVPDAATRTVERLLGVLPPAPGGPPVLDLAALEFVHSVHQAVLPAWLYARAAAAAEVVPPSDETAAGFAECCGLLAALRGHLAVAEWDSGLPLRVIRESIQANEVAEELGRLIARNLDAARAADLVELYGEILDNAVRHGEADPFAVVAAQHFPVENRLEITIADAGIGIPESFRRSPLAANQQLAAARRSTLLLATEAQATSKPDRHTGLGLFLTAETMRMNGGYLRIVSQHEELVLDENRLWIGAASAPWRGTLILLELRTDRALPLADANELVDGAPCDRYAECVLALRIYGERLVTRERGRAVRQDVAVLARRGPVIVDAAGVPSLSPSFLDDAFARPPLDASEAPATAVREFRNLSGPARRMLDSLRRRRGIDS